MPRFLAIQALINATLLIFHNVISLAQLAVGGSIATTVVWAIGKRSEHTVTQRLLALVMRSRE